MLAKPVMLRIIYCFSIGPVDVFVMALDDGAVVALAIVAFVVDWHNVTGKPRSRQRNFWRIPS
jgi:hypothetical protein